MKLSETDIDNNIKQRGGNYIRSTLPGGSRHCTTRSSVRPAVHASNHYQHDLEIGLLLRVAAREGSAPTPRSPRPPRSLHGSTIRRRIPAPRQSGTSWMVAMSRQRQFREDRFRRSGDSCRERRPDSTNNPHRPRLTLHHYRRTTEKIRRPVEATRRAAPGTCSDFRARGEKGSKSRERSVEEKRGPDWVEA